MDRMLIPCWAWLALLGLGLIVAGAVLLFLCPTMLESSLTDVGKVGVGISGALGVDPALGIGAILGGIFSILGALAAAYKTFLMK